MPGREPRASAWRPRNLTRTGPPQAEPGISRGGSTGDDATGRPAIIATLRQARPDIVVLTPRPDPGLRPGDGRLGGRWAACRGSHLAQRQSPGRPAPAAGRRFDYIFSATPRPGGAGHAIRTVLVGARPVSGIHPSDHYGLQSDVRY
jgi:hypothetical protein